MRATAASLLLAVLLVAPATAAEGFTTYVDWQEGRFVAGVPAAVDGVNSVTFAFDADRCHRQLLLDLLFTPTAFGAEAPGVGSASLAFEFRAEVHDASGLVSSTRLRQSAYGQSLGTLPSEGAYELRVAFITGADAQWQMRLRAREIPGPDCLPRVVVNEIEANPMGPDAGNEWIELRNLENEDVDLGGWTLTTTHGAPVTLTLPPDTFLAANGFLIVKFVDGQALDNTDETLILTHPFGFVLDTTPPQSDASDDKRTWQRQSDGTWEFLPETPGV